RCLGIRVARPDVPPRRLLLGRADGDRRTRTRAVHVGRRRRARLRRRARRTGRSVCGHGSRCAAAGRDRRRRRAGDRGRRACDAVARGGGAMTRDVGIGIVGYGMMGRAHAYGYTLAPRIRALPRTPRLRVISGRTADAVARAASSYGVERSTTDWRDVVNDPQVDIVDVCTPPGTHAEIVEASVAAGKAVLCEK